MRTAKKNIEQYRERLKNYFLQVDPSANPEQLSELVSCFTLDKFEKKEIILAAGESSDLVCFVLEGMVRVYYIKEDKEITNWFISENMLFAATYSIYTGKKNYTTYEALEDTLVLKINYSTLEKFYDKYHSMEHLGRVMIQAYYAAFIKKTYDVLSLSADDRYQLFVKENSGLLIRISLKYIASYLGITQETLSRLRAKQ